MQQWNINFIRELYNKYLKLSRETKDPTLSLEYENTANSIFNIMARYDELVNKRIRLDGSYERVNFRYVIDDDFELLDYFGCYCPYIRRINEFGESISVNPNEDLPRINTDTNRILTVSRDFYDSIDGVFGRTYSSLEGRLDKTLHIRKLSPNIVTNGQTYSVYKTDITFIELGVNQTTQDYVSAIHEFGHGISCAINPMAMYDYNKYCFIELESLFFELLGLDYLSDNLDLSKDTFDISMQVLKDYIYSARLICSKLDMYNTLGANQVYNKRIISKFLTDEFGYSSVGIKDVLRTRIRDYFHYIISYLTAIELYMIYQCDKTLALDLLYKIISSEQSYAIEYLNHVKQLGLEPGKNFEKYVEILFNKAKDLKDEKSLRYKN